MNEFQVNFCMENIVKKFFFREIDFILDFTIFFWPGFCF